jgi:hypothetical protein
MTGMREAITQRRFAEFHAQAREGWAQGDLSPI